MFWLWYIFAGIAGGVLAGMGMGGGTLTIPLLVLLLGVPQLTAQYVNLLAFLPTGAAALCVHLKNGLVSGKGLAYVLLPAVAASAAASVFAVDVSTELLGKLFGGFLVALAAAGMGAAVLKKQ